MLIGSYYFVPPEGLPPLVVNSFYFIIFAFIVFCLSRPFKSILRPFILLIANIVFLYSFSLSALIYVVILASLSYLLGILIAKYKSKILLLISIIPYVLVILYFKYAGLFVNTTPIMPLGLSFYTFKIISYLIDVYKNNDNLVLNPLYYLDYVMFFPVITAGPINRSKPFIEELKNPREFDYKEAKGGGFQMMLGIFEKMVLCDYVAIFVNTILDNNEIVGLAVLFGIILYSFQIYLDFDSYSNIAIGLSRLLGFNLSKNFNSPYLARNLQEFWNRWHISLSTWLKDYIYIPLGGSRKGTIRKYINILIVFLVSGIWHGSTWNFILWGFLHALIRIIEEILLKPFKNLKINKILLSVISILGIIINFIIVTFLWLIFKYQTMGEVMEILRRMAITSPLDLLELGFTNNQIIWLGIVLTVVIVFDILRNFFNMINVHNRLFILFRWIIYFVLIVVFLIFGVYGGSFAATDFIYQFF